MTVSLVKIAMALAVVFGIFVIGGFIKTEGQLKEKQERFCGELNMAQMEDKTIFYCRGDPALYKVCDYPLGIEIIGKVGSEKNKCNQYNIVGQARTKEQIEELYSEYK